MAYRDRPAADPSLANQSPLTLAPRYRLWTRKNARRATRLTALLPFAILLILVAGKCLSFEGTVGAVLTIFVGIVLVMWREVRRTKVRTSLRSLPVLLAEGKTRQAGAFCEAHLQRRLFDTPLRATLVLYRGFTLMKLGDLEASANLFAEIERAGWFAADDRDHALFLHGKLLLAALQGDLEEAAKLCQHAVALGAEKTRDYTFVLAQAIFALRRNDVLGAIELTREYADPHVRWKHLRLVRAYALSRSGLPIGDLTVQSLLDSVRPSAPHEVEYLGLTWPDFRTFLQDNDFLPVLDDAPG